MKVIVTGANGQLGMDVVNCFGKMGSQVYGLSHQELDVTNNKQVVEVFETINPDVIIHCGAYTKVDLAESEPENAYLVNAYGTRNIAVAAEACGAKLVYVSTDYVFNGGGRVPYHEFDDTDPIGVYGRSKLAGEEFVRQLHSRWFIVRTSWVFGLHGNNFVKTMLQLAQVRDILSVVHDQIGCPTYTVDLAQTIAEIIGTTNYGTYHVSNSGQCSWFEFAKEIFEKADIPINVIPVTTEEFPRPAKRPAYSVLDHMALRLNGFKEPRHWKDALSSFLNDLKTN
ncbi:dTDP-4-dehydrorhamnose reductase [Cohnella xylanilytica]|uniref:dTDP-4-dehydrorhamnose reductase n=1 Tax=Cohnella xylanilytica TaxID=557555 RepID=UPI001BB40F7E|nr:dTDP-4-dehydrorhamnose reductase [Cohnella xylanilytica]